MSLLLIIVAFLGTALLASATTYIWQQRALRGLQAELARRDATAAQTAARIAELESLRDGQGRQLDGLRERVQALAVERERDATLLGAARQDIQDLRSALAQTEARLRGEQDALVHARATQAALQKECETLRSQLAAQREWVIEQTALFESKVLAAAAKLMDERGKALGEQSRQQVEGVVGPFREQLKDFRARVDTIYAAENTERGQLREQIVQLTNLNQVVSAQADRLTRALTITSKSTGDWGETILQRILEDSGLRAGHEYDLQLSITGAGGERLQPDAVIHLPEGRQLVVDSKVSNKAWTEYCSAPEEERKGLLEQHLVSLRAHLKSLSGKDYARSPDLHTVEFVLMFVPVEAALLSALAADQSLYTDAYRSRIILVSPSTLMAVVKLVEGIWTFQKRKESADEIAEAGRKLYEKLSSFANTFLEVGNAISGAHEKYERALGQLATGKGNAIRLAQRMVELGVTPGSGKSLPQELLGEDTESDLA